MLTPINLSSLGVVAMMALQYNKKIYLDFKIMFLDGVIGRRGMTNTASSL
jgi:hypothetical protein